MLSKRHVLVNTHTGIKFFTLVLWGTLVPGIFFNLLAKNLVLF